MSDINKQQLLDELIAQGFNDVAAQGIIANADVETGGTFSPTQLQGNGGNGYGVFQFDYMRPFYNQWLLDQDKGNTIQSQAEFMRNSIMGDKPFQVRRSAEHDYVQAMNEKDRLALKAILGNPMSAEEATMAFQDYYEKPGIPHSEERLDAIPELSVPGELVPQTEEPFRWSSLAPDYITEPISETVKAPNYYRASLASGVSVPELRGLNPWPDKGIPKDADITVKRYSSEFQQDKSDFKSYLKDIFGEKK